MKRALTLLSALLLVGLLAGCSDDDLSPTGTDDPVDTVETTDNGDGSFTTVVSAGGLDATESVYFSFATGAQVERAEGDPWELSFQFANILLNGGAHGDGGVCLYAFDDGEYAALTTAPDAVYVTDGENDSAMDDSDQAITTGDSWYVYSGPPDHTFTLRPERYYALRLVDGSYMKFQIVGFLQDGTITFDWEPIAGDFAVVTAQVAPAGGYETMVAAGGFGSQDWIYLDLSSGLQSMPGDPADSSDWDLAFKSVDIAVNGGVTGSGNVGVVVSEDAGYDALTQAPASGYISDMTDAPAFDSGSGWYTYTGPPDHLILVHSDHYFVVQDAAGDYYKLRMVDYYSPMGESGHPSFEWEAISAP